MDDDDKLEIVGYEIELGADMDAIIEQKTKEAEEYIAECRVNFRWGKKQLDLVKSVAEGMGVPYQTYMKQAIYRQALEDKQKMASAAPAKWAALSPAVSVQLNPNLAGIAEMQQLREFQDLLDDSKGVNPLQVARELLAGDLDERIGNE